MNRDATFLTYQGVPIAKPRMTQRDKWAQRPAVLRYRAYCDALRELAGPMPEGPLRVVILFGMPMPKSWSAAKRAAHLNREHTQKPDVDNLAKGVLDALLEDDSRVWSIIASKGWTEVPCVSVVVDSVRTESFPYG